MKEILAQAQAAIAELLSAAVTLKPGDMMVVGCSTSEICGQMIGTGSSQEAAQAVMDALLPAARERGLYLCVQCCEHLNRKPGGGTGLYGSLRPTAGLGPAPAPCWGRHGPGSHGPLPRPGNGGGPTGESRRRTGYRRYPHRDAPQARGGPRPRQNPPHRPGDLGDGLDPSEICWRPQGPI